LEVPVVVALPPQAAPQLGGAFLELNDLQGNDFGLDLNQALDEDMGGIEVFIPDIQVMPDELQEDDLMAE